MAHKGKLNNCSDQLTACLFFFGSHKWGGVTEPKKVDKLSDTYQKA
jgi:hypothetical protein